MGHPEEEVEEVGEKSSPRRTQRATELTEKFGLDAGSEERFLAAKTSLGMTGRFVLGLSRGTCGSERIIAKRDGKHYLAAWTSLGMTGWFFST